MFEAVLFDLDGTLLDIDMDFFQYYFRAMGEMAAEKGFGDPVQLVELVTRCTWDMIRDCNCENTNKKTFMNKFLAQWPCSENQAADFFNEFYASKYPLLQQHCKTFPGMKEMMAELCKHDQKIVIATQAIFPIEPIQWRMNWAEVGDFQYELVTSYEHMHYCKPYTEYYAEIVERIGVSSANCLMVGNDTGADLPASALGMKTFLLEERLIDKGNSPYRPDWRGKLSDLYSFMKETFG
ncbi:MAG: 2-deoxyglucose-6-phosphatase [Pelotomaculum sp. PtaB.Bin104]|nr:MAG: 2-deoxyglucose-6-phosphatase [Pelotomaculum sp. PtaB.Bin104]